MMWSPLPRGAGSITSITEADGIIRIPNHAEGLNEHEPVTAELLRPVKKGDEVEKDQPLLIMEAMKMEMTIRAGCAGVVEELPVSANDQVQDGTLLVSIESAD